MGGIPTSVDAKEKIVVPFRVVLLKSFDPSVADGTGGGCSSYAGSMSSSYSYECANDTTSSGGSSTSLTHSSSGCTGGGGSGAGGSGTGSGGSSSVSYSGGSGTASGGGGSSSQSLSGEQCAPACPNGDCAVPGQGAGNE